ncbi:ABC transporter permease [Deinococcus yavapaiensis]|uniref:ABC-2 type transport system permease protein n=1 Tax=Deinococcus yavapaiensis KR-236 TaxID=694435 RepID=A0A318SQP0_9DEIO|nr:ABC transporter permease [Deinococcus yavapaiensis]PYE55183.1 ABC-2 type transport system permease protein [Deinococcus yavapaiensis KR-236]
MLSLIALEYRKLIGFRSVRLALIVAVLLPWIWSFAPRLQDVYNLILVSGWQVPALALITAAQFLLPIFVAVTSAELIGSEISSGTLAPLLLRPLSRSKLLAAKLLTALTYPLLLVGVLLLASLLAGARFGFAEFAGGTGFGATGFVGQGLLSPSAALGDIVRGFLLAAATLMPIAALALLFGVLYLNTAAAALATIATLLLMRLLVVFPINFQQLLLTTHLDAYVQPDPSAVTRSLILLAIYTVGFGLLSVFTFERKDV